MAVVSLPQQGANTLAWFGSALAGIRGGDYGRVPILRKPPLCRAGGKAQAASHRRQKMGSHKKKKGEEK